VHVTCTASDSGVIGSTTFTNADLQTDSGDDTNGTGGIHPAVHEAIPASPVANGPAISGHIHVNGSQDNFHVVFNEQIANPDGSITFNAVHEFLDGPTAVGTVIIGQTVCGATSATTTTVNSSLNPSVFGQNVNFTATVTASGTPTGTVQFKVDGSNFGGPVTLVGGTATSATTSSLGAGPHAVQAVYSGDGAALTGSTGTLNQTVNKAASTTGVTSSMNPAGLFDQVTFTATVSPVAPGAGTQTGTVQFKNNGADLGTPVALNAAGQATTSVSGLNLGGGAHAIAAVYSGDTNFTGSTSAVLNQSIALICIVGVCI